MTEQELNNRITEILKVSEKDAQLCQTSGGRRTGRQYRRVQRARHDDRLLFLIQHSGYAPNIGYIIGDYEEKTTLLHSGLHIKYMKSSSRQQYLKRKANRKARKYCGCQVKGIGVVRCLTIGGNCIERLNLSCSICCHAYMEQGQCVFRQRNYTAVFHMFS